MKRNGTLFQVSNIPRALLALSFAVVSKEDYQYFLDLYFL